MEQCEYIVGLAEPTESLVLVVKDRAAKGVLASWAFSDFGAFTVTTVHMTVIAILW